MYGFDGDMTALEWADAFGFNQVSTDDQQLLIADGFYTAEGHRIFLPTETLCNNLFFSTRHMPTEEHFVVVGT